MTELLQRAFQELETRYDAKSQNLIANFLIKHVQDLPELISDELEEYNFDKCAKAALESEETQAVINNFMKNYDPNRMYTNVKQA